MATPGPGRPKSNVVTVNIGDKEFTRTYEREDISTVEEAVTLLSDAVKGAEFISDRNYGHDLRLRGGVKAKIMAEYAGPERALAKIASGIMAFRASIGKPVTEERAMEMAKAQAE